MKKILSLALSLVLLLTCVFTGMQLTTVSAQTPTESYEVATSVKQQDGYLGGVISSEATQNITKGEAATVTAVPFYGNGFIGWYNGTQLVSKEPSYTFAPTGDVALEAVFDIKNLIENGDAEITSHHSTLASNFNNPAVPKYQENCYATTSVISTDGLLNTDSKYGNYALKLAPVQATGTSVINKIKSLGHFKFKVKKNTDYIIRFSYKFDDDIAVFKTSGQTHALHMAIAGLGTNGKIQWDDTDNTFKWTYHAQPDGVGNDTNNGKFKNSWSWNGSVGHSTDAYVSKFVHDGGTATADVWHEVYMLFNPMEDASIFQSAGQDGVAVFTLGTHWDTTDFIVLDNFSISEAAANDRSTVSAQRGGSVATSAPRTTDNYYVYTTGARGNNATFTGRDTSKVFYPSIYEKYAVTLDANAAFVGWYDSSDNLVSKSPEAYLLANGEQYTARIATDISKEGGGYLADNGDGTYTAKAFYGNKFLGWYDGTTSPYTFKTAEPTITKEGHLGYVAMFTEDNLIYDGDFEVNANTAAVYNAYTDYDATRAGVNSIVPVSVPSGPEFGENCLQITPSQVSHASKRKGLVNIPVTLEQGKQYLWKFSYAIIGNNYVAANDCLYLSVDPADNNGKVPWTSEGGTKYSYHVQLASHNGVNTGNYAWGDWTSDNKTHYSTTQAVSTIGEWVDVYVIFTADVAGTHFLTLGCYEAQMNSYLFDNISLSEAAKNPANLVSVTAGANGKVHSFRTDEAAHTTSKPRGTADIYQKYVDTANSYYTDMYVDFFATPDVGFVFDGWYDANNQRVSSEIALRVPMVSDETYTAKFIADPNKYSATAVVENKNGVKGGYIVGETAKSQIGSGEKVTFTAAAYTGNTFLGWYNGDTLVTDELTVEYTVRKDITLTAKFEINNLFADSGYENAAQADSVLGAGLEWTSDSATASAGVVGNEYASGEKAILVTAPGAVISTSFATAANTPYYLSFMFKSADTAGIEYVKLLADGSQQLGVVENIAATGEWQKVTLVVNSGTAQNVTLEIKCAAENVYLDDLVFCNASLVPFDITASVEHKNGIYGGYIQGDKAFSVTYGAPVTVTAVPYEKNTFLGWYDGEKLISSDATCTFAAYGFADIVAKFDIKNLWPDSGYENTELDISQSENGNWVVNSKLHEMYDFDVTVTDDGDIKSGKQMLRVMHRGNSVTTDIPGLKENTNYFLTFSVRTHKTLQNCYFQHAKVIGLSSGAVLGTGFGSANGGQWEDIAVPFNSGDNTQITVELLYQAGEEACYFDNFALFESNDIRAFAGDGGTITSTLNGGANGPATTGTSVTLTATPDSGNTFLGWYDYKDSDTLISTANPYTFTVDSSKYILAKFAGENVKPENLIVDGDFENGLFEGFTFSGTTKEANCSFCTYQLTKAVGGVAPVSGDYMVKVAANSRTSSLLVDNLKPHTDYTVSFYWLGNEFINIAYVAAYRYQPEFSYVLDQTTKLNQQNVMLRYNQTDMRAKAQTYVSAVGDGDGKHWRKVELSFNSGNRDEALIALNYSRSGGADGLYLDNFSLTEGSIYSETVENGDFEGAATEKGWHGEYTVAQEGENKVGKSSSVIYNGVTMDSYKGYTLTFKARSDNAAEIIYGAAQNGATKLYDNSRITSYSGVSYEKATLTDEWEEYSVSFMSTGYVQANMVLQALSGEFMVDDVKFAAADELVPVQKLTFDSAELRYIVNASFESILSPNAHRNPHNPDWYDYSTDARSGDGSLLMKANTEYAYHALSQPWAELDLQSGRSYRVSFYAKAATAGAQFASGVVYTDPKYKLAYPANEVFTLDTTEWTECSFTFSVENITYAALNRATFFVDGIEGKTNCDILFDDVLIEECAQSVTNTAPDKLYTQDLSQNYFQNYSFEKDGDVFAPYVKKGDASFGERYITLEAGDKIVLPVSTRTDYDLAWFGEYVFAADVRGKADSAGTVGLSYSADGKQLMADESGKAVTLPLDTNGKWVRRGFSFSGYRLETEYLVLECTAGSFDIDYIALFNATHAFAENTHDTSVPLSKDEVEVSDMKVDGVKNIVSGDISGLPEGAKVVLVGKNTYTAEIVDGAYTVDIANGEYDMYIAVEGKANMTLWGDLKAQDGRLSGLAVTRLEGEAVAVDARGVSNGIVKITDDDTGYSYLTATDGGGYYTAYILDCNWYVEGTTNESEALSAAGIKVEQFATPSKTTEKGASR